MASVIIPSSQFPLDGDPSRQYQPYARKLTHDARNDLPNVMMLRKQPHRIGVILRALAVWEPHAHGNPSLLNKPVQMAKLPTVIEEIEDTLSDNKFSPFAYYKGKGAASVVCRVKDEALRITIEKEGCRIDSRYMLQPHQHAPIGATGLRFERLQLADTSNTSWHIVQKLYREMALEGNFFWDKAPDNAGTVENRPYVLDGGAAMTEAQLLKCHAQEWIDDYRAIRKSRGLPEFVLANVNGPVF